MAKSKTDDFDREAVRPWARVTGSITTDEHDDQVWRVFRLQAQAYEGGPIWRQCVEVRAARLAAFPNLYKSVLDNMARDLAGQIER